MNKSDKHAILLLSTTMTCGKTVATHQHLHDTSTPVKWIAIFSFSNEITRNRLVSAEDVLKLIHTATPDTTKLSCPCRVRFPGVNWIPPTTQDRHRQKIRSLNTLIAIVPFHSVTPDTTQTTLSCRVWRAVWIGHYIGHRSSSWKVSTSLGQRTRPVFAPARRKQ